MPARSLPMLYAELFRRFSWRAFCASAFVSNSFPLAVSSSACSQDIALRKPVGKLTSTSMICNACR